MKLDIEIYGSLALNPIFVRNLGMHEATLIALKNLGNITLQGSLYVPDSMENEDLWNELGDNSNHEQYLIEDKGAFIFQDGMPNRQVKRILDRL